MFMPSLLSYFLRPPVARGPVRSWRRAAAGITQHSTDLSVGDRMASDQIDGRGITEGAIRTALAQIIDPDLGRDIVSLGFLKEVAIEGDRVAVTIELTTPACPV